MSDTFGIPDNFFGQVPEAFYGALGRVVALGALVEMRLGQVVTAGSTGRMRTSPAGRWRS